MPADTCFAAPSVAHKFQLKVSTYSGGLRWQLTPRFDDLSGQSQFFKVNPFWGLVFVSSDSRFFFLKKLMQA